MTTTGGGAGSPCRMALASSSTSCGVKPARAATAGSTLKTVAGPLMVFSIPSSTSTTPGIFLMAPATWGAQARSNSRILAEQLDDHGLGRAGEIADHVLQKLREFDVQHRLGLRDLGAHVGDHFFAAAFAIGLQLDRDVAGIGFGHLGEAQLQAGAARRALHFGRLAQNLFHMGDHAIGLFERRAGGHDVVDDEAAFVHGGQQVGAGVGVAEIGAADQDERRRRRGSADAPGWCAAPRS